MANKWYDSLPRSSYSQFKKISTSVEWFEIYEIQPDIFVFYEPQHCEEAISNLVIGKNKAALIDTGCGIGNLRAALEKVNDKPVIVINTHTHADHLGGNHQFNEIALFDHPLARKISSEGICHDTIFKEILEESLIIKPWPKDFNPKSHFLRSFEVNNWLKEGDKIDLGDRSLEVIHTPGEAPNHICLLDRVDRVLFSGDALGSSIWAHLEGGSLNDLKESYIKLLNYTDEFDYIMPSHNEPMLDKDYLVQSLSAVESILSGRAKYHIITDEWGENLKQYSFERFRILTL